MRIVFALPSMGFGGAERVVSLLANQLCKNNEVSIVLTSSNLKPVYDIDPKIQVKEFSVELSNWKRWSGFRKYCIAYKADVVFAFMDIIGIMSSICLLFSGIPVIISERNDPSEKTRKLKGVFSILNKISLIAAAGYVFQSEGAKQCYPKIAQKKSTIILNPLDIEHLPVRESTPDNRIVTVGRLHRQKNHKLLIEAFVESKISKESTLHIYGEGNMRRELEELIKKHNAGDKVFLEGNHKDVLERIKNARLFVLSSRYEGLPNCLMEAMCIGIPCVSTDCSPGGARMLIANGVNGYLVPNENKEALVEALDNASDIVKMNKFAEIGKSLREHVSVDEIALQWVRFAKLCIKA